MAHVLRALLLVAAWMWLSTGLSSGAESAEEAVTLFLRHDIHRIPVVRDGVPVGMVSRHDLLRLMMYMNKRGVRP